MSTRSALSGVRVVELGEGIANSFAARLLGDFGADVIKVEELGRPDPVRGTTGRLSHGGPAALFEYLNWNKRAVTVDAEEQITALIASADIVLAGGRHDIDALSSANPRAVVTLVSNFGQSGPYADFEATDLVLHAMSGIMAISGASEREPIRHGLRTAYYLAGLNAAYASLAALLGAQRTGEGVVIDLAIRDCLTSELVMNHAYHIFSGVIQERQDGAGDPFDGHPLATARGFLSLQTSARQATEQIADLLEMPELADARFATAEQRRTTAAELRQLLSERLDGLAASDVFLRASARGLLSGTVQDAEALLQCPHLEARGLYFQLSERTDGGESWRLPAELARLSVTPTSVRRRAPLAATELASVLAEPRRPRPQPSTAPRLPVKPLQGIRVLDLSVIFAVPYMGALLADLGAEVIKLEAPRRIDQTRTSWGGYFDNDPGAEPWNRSATFQVVNRGKRSFVADLSTPAGRTLLLALAAQSDIVLDNFSPTVPPRLGVSYEDLRAENPALLMLSNTGYGSTGPWSAFKAQGTTLEATMGLMAVTGYADGPPSRAGQSVPDFIACWTGLTALLAALAHRQRTGEGQWIDLGMYQLGPAVIPEMLIAQQAGEPAPKRGAEVDLDAIRSWLVRTHDGWLAVAVQDHRRLAALRRVVGRRSLAEWARDRAAWPAARELQAAGVAAGPVLDAESLIVDPQLQSRGFFEEVEIEQLGQRMPLMGRPYTWRGHSTYVGISNGAPSFGADNDYVLRELLGLDAAEVEHLRDSEVVTDRPLDPPVATAMSRDGIRLAQPQPDAPRRQHA